MAYPGPGYKFGEQKLGIKFGDISGIFMLGVQI